MSKRKPHQRRYPRRKDGTRKPGYVRVSGCDVNLSNNGCLIWVIFIVSALYFSI